MGGPDDEELVGRLRSGDEQAFTELVDRYHAAMVRVATAFVPSRAVAEEVAQDAWLGVLRGLPRFEGRSSLKTWIFKILVNRAKTAGAREPRSLGLDTGDSAESLRFTAGGAWREPPFEWTEEIEDRLAAPEMTARVRKVLDGLPDSQRLVVTLRDVEGLSSGEVCDLLGISDGNQRILLHRGRARVREALEDDVKNWET